MAFNAAEHSSTLPRRRCAHSVRRCNTVSVLPCMAIPTPCSPSPAPMLAHAGLHTCLAGADASRSLHPSCLAHVQEGKSGMRICNAGFHSVSKSRDGQLHRPPGAAYAVFDNSQVR